MVLVLLSSEPDFKKEIHNIYTFQTLDKRTRLENHFPSGDNYWLRFHKSVTSLAMYCIDLDYHTLYQHYLIFQRKLLQIVLLERTFMLCYSYYEPILTMELSYSGCTFLRTSTPLFARIFNIQAFVFTIHYRYCYHLFPLFLFIYIQQNT